MHTRANDVADNDSHGVTDRFTDDESDSIADRIPNDESYRRAHAVPYSASDVLVHRRNMESRR